MNSTPLGFLLGVLTAVVAFALVLATQPRATCLRGEVTACSRYVTTRQVSIDTSGIACRSVPGVTTGGR